MDAYIMPSGKERRVEIVRDSGNQRHPIEGTLQAAGVTVEPVLGHVAYRLPDAAFKKVFPEIALSCEIHACADPTGPTGLLHETIEDYFSHGSSVVKPS